ncbi:hypothetical protein ACFLT8_01915 [Chloroflexota bacterium]
MIKKGDEVRVACPMSDIAEEYDPLTYEHTSCLLGKVGVVKSEPVWLESKSDKGSLGSVVAKGECWVEFVIRKDSLGQEE